MIWQKIKSHTLKLQIWHRWFSFYRRSSLRSIFRCSKKLSTGWNQALFFTSEIMADMTSDSSIWPVKEIENLKTTFIWNSMVCVSIISTRISFNLWLKNVDWKKLKSICIVNYFKTVKLGLKCTEFGCRDDFTSRQSINFSRSKSMRNFNVIKNSKSLSFRMKNMMLRNKNKANKMGKVTNKSNRIVIKTKNCSNDLHVIKNDLFLSLILDYTKMIDCW